MMDRTGRIEIKIGQIVKIPNHATNCFVHDIIEWDNFILAENDLGYFCKVDQKDVSVIKDILLPENLAND